MSPMHTFLRRLLEFGPRAHAVLDGIAAELPGHQLAALAYAFEGVWARPKQVLPVGAWRSAFFQCGRGFGKTLSAVSFVLREIETNAAVRHVALVGPTDDQTAAVLVTGATGIMALAAPWLGAVYEKATQRVTFANGAVCSLYSAQTPTRLRGPQHQLAIATEIAWWPETTRDATFDNLELGTRTGSGRILIDATPKDSNPLIERLRAEHEADPEHHLLIEGSTEENEINLSPGLVREWRARLKGTDLEATDLDGIYRNEPPSNIFKREAVERSLRGGLAHYGRRIISVDPSTAGRKHSDPIGIIELGLDVGQVYVLRNVGGRLDINEWPDMVLDLYASSHCDLLAVECDHASTAWPKIFSDACRLRGWRFAHVDANSPTRHDVGALNFHSFYVGNARSKAERARAAAAWVDKGRVSFVRGALGGLEKQLYSFTGADNRPDDAVDALVNGIMLLGLAEDVHDPRADFVGFAEVARQVMNPNAPGNHVGPQPAQDAWKRKDPASSSSISFSFPTYGQDRI